MTDEPELTETMYTSGGEVSYRVEWWCEPPALRVAHTVTDEQWRQDEEDNIPVREIRAWRLS
jgi:hypothetical protein